MKQGDVVQDRYILEDLLGSGGMAEVWRAHDSRLERPVAIKVMSARFAEDPEFLIRFFAEAQSVANISHPNVVQVWDFGTFDERPFLVMELLEGGTLRDRTGRPLDPDEALSIVAAVARGAGAAHVTGLVHRDIKPANVLISAEDSPKLADFGISTSLHSERLTSTGTAVGSPQYVSPEQVSAGDLKPASDVYSMGVLLHELLTGRLPFEEENITALAIAHVEKAPTPPSIHVLELSPEIDALVMSCLQKDPDSRLEDGNALANAIERLADGADVAPVRIASTAVPVDDDPGEDADAASPPLSGMARMLSGVAVLGLVLVVALLVWANSNPRSGERARADTQPPAVGRKSPTRDTSPSAAAVGVETTPSPTPSPTSATDRSRSNGSRSDTSSSGSSGKPAPRPTPTPAASPSPTTGASPSPSS
jgi:serine/threonine protein kinase